MELRVFKTWLKSDRDTMVALEIPLAFEAKSYNSLLLRYSPILTVSATPATQLERIMDRDKVSDKDAEKRIEAQTSNDYRVRHSDFIISNDGSLETLRRNTDNFLDTWKRTMPFHFVISPPKRFIASAKTGAKGGILSRVCASILAFPPKDILIVSASAALIVVGYKKFGSFTKMAKKYFLL